MTTQTALPIVAPTIPAPEVLFDLLMSKIEPELTSEGMKTIGEKYKNETPEQSNARRAHYRDALAKYDVAYTEYLQDLKRKTDHYRRDSYAQVESEDRTSDTQSLSAFNFSLAA